MDIEELNRTQIVLLVILVSFVTSIATGIVTVALLAQAPPAVTQTVNHVIQRTVETVVPQVGGTTETIKETTIVVKEEDLVTDTIASTFSRIGAVHASEASTSPIIALGVVVGGVFVTDASVVGDAHLVDFGATSSVYMLKDRILSAGVAVMSGTGGQAFRMADTNSLKLGQSLIAFPSASGTRVGLGNLTSRYPLSSSGDTTIRAIETTVGGSMTLGAPVVNVFGEVVGLYTGVSNAEGQGTFVSMSDIMPLVLGVRGTTTSAAE